MPRAGHRVVFLPFEGRETGFPVLDCADVDDDVIDQASF
jgi:hypothetical protein